MPLRLTAAARGPTHTMVHLPGGLFRMGTDGDEGFADDGEGPARAVEVRPFAISAETVTNAQFSAFVRATGHVTQAEALGSSYVFWLQLSPGRREARQAVAGIPWWLEVEHACWQRPEGAGSHIHGRMDHPVVHVSWFDAMAYCAWAGVQLPTEAQWEYAARGGLQGELYPWGDTLEPEGRPACNIWQGRFPNEPQAPWQPGTLPARSFAPNGHGLYNMAGNVWEWCADWFCPAYHQASGATDPLQAVPTGRRSQRGGSYLCHDSYCNRYRVAARSGNTPSSTAGNCGFRVAAPRP